MTLLHPSAHRAASSRQPWAGAAALIIVSALLPSSGRVLVAFGLALAIAPLCRTRSSAQRDMTRGIAHDMVVVALFGSAAAVLWPLVGRDPAGIGQLISDLYHRGPELWGSARAKSPPEILNTIQGCVQPDRISHLPMSASGGLGQRHSGLMARAFALIMELSATGDAVFAFGRRIARHAGCKARLASAPALAAHGRSPPCWPGTALPRLSFAS